ncbi:MAG: hypothetical protein ABIH27_03570 [Candidatus Omnitrophota bacterium]
MPGRKLFNIVTIIFILITAGNAYGYEDGFGQAKKLTTKQFEVYYSPQLDLSVLAGRLRISFSDRVLAGTDPKQSGSIGGPVFAEALDTLFLSVCSILDMNLYSFQGTIKICRDTSQLNDIYFSLFRSSLGGRFSFYSSDLNTIYISQEHFEREVLGHEIAHAIMSRYFVVQPPVKASEVLAGYVEYQLRKSGQR